MNSSSSASVSPLSESVLLAETLMSRKPLTRSMAWMEREDEEEEVEEHEEQENESERELASSVSFGAGTASFVLSTEPPQLDTLPKFILSQIFSYFSYDKVSKLRRVSKR